MQYLELVVRDLTRDQTRDHAPRQDRSGIRRSARLIALEIRASRRNHRR